MENTSAEPIKKEPGFWAKMLINPIGCPTFLLLGGWLALIFQYIYHPEFYYLTWAILIVLIWIPLLIYFILRSVVQKIVKYFYADIQIVSRQNIR